MLRFSFRHACIVAGAATIFFAISATSTLAKPTIGQGARTKPDIFPAFRSNVKMPALLALNYRRQTLEYWPIDPNGGRRPIQLAAPAGLLAANDIVADGERIAIANTSASNIVTYNLRTKVERTFPDPNSYPIHVAFGKNHAIYAANFPSTKRAPYTVTEYAIGQPPKTLDCQYLGDPAGIALDNEGNVYVNEITPFTGVVELPAGASQQCSELQLQPEQGYPGGLAIDPKTDDLLVLSNPDLCAGGSEGLVTIYPKPYNALTGHQLALGGTCTGGLQLDSTSSIAFLLDETVSAAHVFVTQFTYPSGQPLGLYLGGSPAGVTTLPNTLPD
jgi:hypothetical protein